MHLEHNFCFMRNAIFVGVGTDFHCCDEEAISRPFPESSHIPYEEFNYVNTPRGLCLTHGAWRMGADGVQCTRYILIS